MSPHTFAPAPGGASLRRMVLAQSRMEARLMLRNGVQDMREMVEGDVRFSQQFGMVV